MPSCCHIRGWLQNDHNIATKDSQTFDATTSKPHYAPTLLVEPIHISISIRFDIDAHTLQVHLKQKFKANSSGSHSVRLNAVGFRELTVDDSVRHYYDGKHLDLSWLEPFTRHEERVVEIKYKVIQPITGMFFSTPTALYPKRPIWAVTDHESERARYWLACVDFPAVRTTLEFELYAPKNYVALANGKLQSESEDGTDGKVSRWKLDYRCPSYLICIAVGDFERVNDGSVDGVEIAYFAPRGQNGDGDLMRAFDKTPDMIRWIQKKLQTPFPWPKYFQLACADVGGAMENISLVTWSDRFLLDATSALERKYLVDQVNIHEMAHTYFGDLVVIRNFEHVWMKESWATYMECVWIQDHLSQDDFRIVCASDCLETLRLVLVALRPAHVIKRFGETKLTISYPGGCWRIHMLRMRLGEDNFWSGVRDYLHQYSGKTVETEDFRRVLENQSGENLTEFFDQWFYSRGFPKLKGSFEFSNETHTVLIRLEQTQVEKNSGSSSSTSSALFTFPVECQILDDQGSVYNLELKFQNGASVIFASTQLASGRKPQTLCVDPNGHLLCTVEMNPGEEILKNTAKGASDVVSRIRAFQELIRIASPSTFDTVDNLLASETFYGVRVKAAEFLYESKSFSAILVLKNMLIREKNPMAMWSIARACRLRDPSIRQALLQFLARSDIPYRAREHALESLGYQADARDFDYLKSVALDDNLIGQHDRIRCGALHALGHHRSVESFSYLLERVRHVGLEPERYAFAACVEALVESTRWQDSLPARSATPRLSTLNVLLDIVVRNQEKLEVREKALSGLASLEGKEVLGDLEDALASIKAFYAEQDHPFILEQVNRIRSGGGQVKELQKRIEDLESKLQKLAVRVEAVAVEKTEWVVVDKK